MLLNHYGPLTLAEVCLQLEALAPGRSTTSIRAQAESYEGWSEIPPFPVIWRDRRPFPMTVSSAFSP